MIKVAKLFWSVVVLSLSVSAHSNSLCDADYLQQCDLNSDDPDVCLEKHYACGAYEEIIQHYGAAQFSTATRDRYFKGVAYFGLYNRNRANSVKCYLARAGKLELTAFLKQQAEEGHNTVEAFNRTYHASKVYKEFTQVTGCQESALLAEEIQQLTEAYTDEVLKGLFVGAIPNNGLGIKVAEMRTNIQNAVGGFISKASAIETQLNMREIGLDMSENRIESIVEIINGSFGEASVDIELDGNIENVNVVFNNSSHFQVAKLNAEYWINAIESKEQKLVEAMNAVNINDYEAARDEVVSKAIYVEQESTAHLSFSTPLNSSIPLNNLYDQALATDTGGTVGGTLEHIHQSWATTPAGLFYCMYMPSSFWYCSEP